MVCYEWYANVNNKSISNIITTIIKAKNKKILAISRKGGWG